MAGHWHRVIWFLAAATCVHGALKFANSIADHMVLQRGPKRAILWGYADVINDTVTVVKNGVNVGTTTVQKLPSKGTEGFWKIKLPPETHPGPFSITIKSSEGSVTINDVMYGDVWMCSGQSNMQFTMREVYNSEAEVNDSLNYPNIRMLFSKLTPSDFPLNNVQLQMPWLKPTKGFIENFSALCFMFGRELQKHLNYPIGLIESNWGGTKIEVWSSPDAITACSDHGVGKRRKRFPSRISELWNSMIHPYLDTTIEGAIWYQGESNAGAYDLYSCQFPAMIADWRQKFYAGTDGETDKQFPFGFVQLAPIHDADKVSAVAPQRWAQTAKYGYAPNPSMPNTFMAVAADLPDYNSPSGSIHPRYKQDIARRLVLGALHVAYGQTGITFQGPFPTDIYLTTIAGKPILRILYNSGMENLEVKSSKGFEVCCTSTCSDLQPWTNAPISTHHVATVDLDASVCPSGTSVTAVRYIWRESPCALRLCPLYSATSNLPAPPFKKTGPFETRVSSGAVG